MTAEMAPAVPAGQRVSLAVAKSRGMPAQDGADFLQLVTGRSRSDGTADLPSGDAETFTQNACKRDGDRPEIKACDDMAKDFSKDLAEDIKGDATVVAGWVATGHALLAPPPQSESLDVGPDPAGPPDHAQRDQPLAPCSRMALSRPAQVEGALPEMVYIQGIAPPAAGAVSVALDAAAIAGPIRTWNEHAASGGLVRHLELTLHPVELGTVSVRLRLNGGALDVVIDAASAPAREAIVRDPAPLLRALTGTIPAGAGVTLHLGGEAMPLAAIQTSNQPSPGFGGSAQTETALSGAFAGGGGSGQRPMAGHGTGRWSSRAERAIPELPDDATYRGVII